MIKNILPEKIKGFLIQRFHNVQSLQKLTDVNVKIATTFEELKAASELLHDSYVGKKLMEPHPSGMRCNVHSFLPHCTVIIAYNTNGKIIGTVSLIKDGPMGLPAESAFIQEFVSIRSSKNRELVEVSALANDPAYRKESHAVLFLLNRFLYLYCRDILLINTLIIVIHPDVQYFYQALLLFKPCGKVVAYNFVKGALARLMYLDFSGDYEMTIWNDVYKKRKDSIVDYILNCPEERIKMPALNEDTVDVKDKDSAIALINASQFNLSDLKIRELSYLITGLNLNKADLTKLGINSLLNENSYRFQKKFNASGMINNQHCIFRVYDLSSEGAFLEAPLEVLSESTNTGQINFQWKGQEFSSYFHVRWINHGQSKKLPLGIGIEFVGQKLNFFEAA